jgi:hypothetical protein
MVVVDGARKLINKTIDITVTSVHQTTAGKMIFGRCDERGEPQPQRTPPALSHHTPSPSSAPPSHSSGDVAPQHSAPAARPMESASASASASASGTPTGNGGNGGGGERPPRPLYPEGTRS